MIDCGICGEKRGALEYMDVPDFFLEKNYIITVCPSCGVRKTNPFPDDIPSLYKTQSYNKRQNGLFRACKGILMRHEIKRIFKYTQNRSFLDAGSGGGEFSEELFKLGYDTITSDSAPERPVYLNNILEIPYVKFNYENYTMADQLASKGRTVILRHVLEHVRDPEKFLRQFIENEASFFYVAVPNTDCLEQKIFKRYYSTWYVPYHLWHFNLLSLNKLFKRTGVELIAWGHDTIPTILMHIYFYMREKKCPDIIKNFFVPTGGALVLTSPINLIFLNNVIWVIGKALKER